MKKTVINIILVLCILIFAGSGLYLLKYYMQAGETKKEIQELAEWKETDEITEEEKEEAKQIGVLDKYIRLYKKNSDLVGWIKIDGTQIDYPVMQNVKDAEYYLHRNFNRKEDKNGLPFLASGCDVQDVNSNLVVYGHHMKSGMMFTDLLRYKDRTFWKEHPEVTFDTLNGTGSYRVFAAFYTDVTEGSGHFKFYDYAGSLDEEMYHKYVKEVAEKAIYPTKFLPEYGQTLLTLVTCNYHTDNGRFVVVAAQ